MFKSKACFIIFLACTIYSVHAQETSIDIEVDFEFDPCTLKECANDEVCRVVEHAQLLEIPVAACVKDNARPTESAQQCMTLEIGSNILNCKTLSDWILLGHNQCSLEEEKTRIQYELDQRSVKTKYVCHEKTGEERKFLSVKFDCCKKETPSVLTVATPGTTTASGRPIEDEEGGPSPSDHQSSNDISLPVTNPSVKEHPITAATIIVDTDSPNEEDQEGTLVSSSDSTDENEDTGLVRGFLFLAGVIVVGCLIFSVGLGAYIRFLSKNNTKKNKRPPTVFVNQNCDEYKNVLEQKEPIFKNIYF